MARPSLTVSIRIARSPKTVADHVVLALFSGGLLGPGAVIQRRDARQIHFAEIGGVLPDLPDRGEIELREVESGETLLTCRLYCSRMTRRRMLRSALLGTLTTTGASLGLGWPLTWALVLGVGVALAWDLASARRERASLRRRVEAFASNTNYLRAL